MAKALLICGTQVGARQLKDELHAEGVTCQMVSDWQPLSELARKHPTDVLLLELHKLSSEKIQFLSDLRFQEQDSRLTPMILVGLPNSADVLTRLESLGSIVSLTDPFVAKDVVGLVKKMERNDQVAQRIHRRFSTRQPVTLESFKAGESITATVLNLSKGGAYIHSESNVDLKVGEMVFLSVHLDQLKRDRRMNAKVVWVKKNTQKNECNLGVAFVSPEDVYKEVLSGI